MDMPRCEPFGVLLGKILGPEKTPFDVVKVWR
jgi:hypothetical protein